MDNWHMKITDNYITVDRNKLGKENLYSAIQWAKKNCPHYITNQYHRDDNVITHDLIDFYFLDYPSARKDMCWFILRWS
jgi:hypothetical protein